MTNARILSTAAATFFGFALPTTAAPLAYEDVDTVLDTLPEPCEPCATFYRVDRPLVESVLDHSYVSARYTTTCEGSTVHLGDVEYGLSKGAADHDYFVASLMNPAEAYGLREIVTACGDDLRATHAAASRQTAEWRLRESNGLFYFWDMLTAPVGGRPCGNAADAVEADISPEA